MKEPKKEIYIENLNKIKKINPKLSIYRAEKLSEQISCTNIVHNKEDIKQWIKERKSAFQSSVKKKYQLTKPKDGNMTRKEI